MQPRYILGLIRKWLWLIILAALIGGAVGAGVDHILPKKYEADATLFVSSPNHIDENSVLGDQQAARALANFSQSNSVLQATLNSLHIHDLTLPQLTSMVTVQNDLDSQFVIVQVRDKDSQRAAKLASEIGNPFTGCTGSPKTCWSGIYSGNSNWHVGRLDCYRGSDYRH